VVGLAVRTTGRGVGNSVSAKVGTSEGAVLGSIDGTPRSISGPSDDVRLVVGLAVRTVVVVGLAVRTTVVVGLTVRTGVRSNGVAVAPCDGSVTARASIVTLANDLIDDRRFNEVRRPPGTVVVEDVVVHPAIDALRRWVACGVR